MRLIGHVENQTQAERFAAYLLTKDMPSQIEPQPDGGPWDIWIRNEDDIDPAREELDSFRQNPDAEVYRKAVDAAQQIQREQIRQARKIQKQQVHVSTQQWQAPLHKVAPLVTAMIVISSVVWLLTGLGENHNSHVFRALTFTAVPFEQTGSVGESALSETGPVSYDARLRLASILRGEFWRTVTPIFLHFGPVHLLFNMWWLMALGKQVEYRYGSWRMLALVVFVAVCSNVVGAIIPANVDGVPVVFLDGEWVMLAGGMSGVVYGLFGFIWMKLLFDPKSRFFLSPGTVLIMIGWLFVCMLPQFQEFLGHKVNNWAHGVGLLAGMAIGYWPTLLQDLGFGRSGTGKNSGSDSQDTG